MLWVARDCLFSWTVQVWLGTGIFFSSQQQLLAWQLIIKYCQPENIVPCPLDRNHGAGASTHNVLVERFGSFKFCLIFIAVMIDWLLAVDLQPVNILQ